MFFRDIIYRMMSLVSWSDLNIIYHYNQVRGEIDLIKLTPKYNVIVCKQSLYHSVAIKCK